MRPSFILAGVLIASPVLAAASGQDSESQTTSSSAAPPLSSIPASIFPFTAPNLLGNGGFEPWNHGSGPMDLVAPDRWYAMSSRADFFFQGFILFTKSNEVPNSVH